LLPNRRLQLTAFGARDRAFFEVILCRASAAAEAQHGRPRENGISILYSRNRECGMQEVILPCPIS